MVLLDLLGRRWALRVLWELRDEDVPTFRELQARCGQISSSVLNERLRELRDAGIVAGPPNAGYRLTEQGQSLLHALGPIDAWSRHWARSASIDELD
jgi:DNA-binding HxlR family transcriptional regulator